MELVNKKKANVAKTAVARELACFIWGMMTDNIARKLSRCCTPLVAPLPAHFSSQGLSAGSRSLYSCLFRLWRPPASAALRDRPGNAREVITKWYVISPKVSCKRFGFCKIKVQLSRLICDGTDLRIRF